MSLKDVFELTLIGEMEGQPVHNVFNYETSLQPGPDIIAKDIIDSWIASTLQTKWLLSFAGAYVLQAYRCQRLYNGDTATLKSLQPVQVVVNAAGTLGLLPVPSLSTIISFYNTNLGPDEEFFSGKKFMSAGSEGSTEDGQIEPILLATIGDFFDELTTPLATTGGNTVVFGVWSLQNALLLDPTVFLPVTTVSTRLNLGALQRRKRGTSTGGFQP